MKVKIVALILFLMSLNSYAFSVKKSALVRNKHFRPKIKKVILTDLISDDSYSGKYFKVVEGKSNKAISFKSSRKLQLRAATTYYHFSKARRFFVEKLRSKYVMQMPVIVVRLQIKNVFSELGHFAHDNLTPQYNNALSIPAGRGYAPKGIRPWNIEVWFRPVRKIHYKELPGGGSMNKMLRPMFKQFRKQMHMSTFKQFLSGFIEGSFAVTGSTLVKSIMRTAGASILLELCYQTSGSWLKLFRKRWFYLDTAMVPEIIYHEFSHVALSNQLKMSHSTPVNEGIADYFAGVIANSKKLATKIKKYNTFNGKKARKSDIYRTAFENGEFANADFVFGLLWQLRKVLGKDNANMLISKMIKRINSNATIHKQLVTALLEECRVSCKNKNIDRYKIMRMLHDRGI